MNAPLDSNILYIVLFCLNCSDCVAYVPDEAFTNEQYLALCSSSIIFCTKEGTCF